MTKKYLLPLIFPALVLSAHITQIDGLKNIAVVFIIVYMVSMIAALLVSNRPEMRSDMNTLGKPIRKYGRVVSLLSLVSLIFAGWFVTAIMYVIGLIALTAARDNYSKGVTNNG